MPDQITLPADAVSKSAAVIEELERQRSTVQDEMSAARATLDQLEVEAEAAAARRASLEARASWERRMATARATITRGEHRLVDLDREIREQRQLAAQAEAAGVPNIDGQILNARARLETIPQELELAEGALARAEWRQSQIEASRTLGEPTSSDEVAEAAATIVEARGTIETLGAERTRLEGMIEALLERRADWVEERAAAGRARILTAWEPLAEEALSLAERLQEVGAEMDRLDSEYRAVQAAPGTRPTPVPTIDDIRFEAAELERLVGRARGLAIRD